MNGAAKTGLYKVVTVDGCVALKQCLCGAAYTHAEWQAMPRREWRIAGDHLELAVCRCGSTISVRLGDDPASAGDVS